MVEPSAEPFSGYSAMVRIVGRKFATCWFDNFHVFDDEYSDGRRYAKEVVADFARSLRDDPRSGQNLILMGSIGTGKDHLAVSVLRVALGLGLGAKLERGSSLCTRCRKHYNESAEEVPQDILDVDLLVISDIEPSTNVASEFEQRAYLRLIDYRYVHTLPTVVTTNVQKRSELARIIGERSVSRLFENCVKVPMNGPDQRKRKNT